MAGDWSGHEQKLLVLNTKIAALENELHEMIERKDSVDDPAGLKELLQDMVKKHKELQETARDREAELVHMRFQHPEKGDLNKREYSRYQVKSLEQMEEDQDLDGKLTRIKSMVELKYKVEPARKADGGGEKSRQPATADGVDDGRITLKK